MHCRKICMCVALGIEFIYIQRHWELDYFVCADMGLTEPRFVCPIGNLEKIVSEAPTALSRQSVPLFALSGDVTSKIPVQRDKSCP